MTLQQVSVTIEHDSQVGEARRLAAALAQRAKLTDEAAGRVAIIVNELGTNIRKHAGSGELLLADLPEGGLEVVALDKGPGMNVESSMRDGYSTAGTRGEGLGAVRRQADVFDAWSLSGHGAVVMARIFAGKEQASPVQLGAVNQPLRGEVQCGDAWAEHRKGATVRVLIADGLGHGPIAARAADEAVRAFRTNVTAPTVEALVHSLHAAMKPTRGGAIAVAELDLIARETRFCGVGNIAATIDAPGARSKGLLSHNGIAGHEARRIQQFSAAWPSHGVLILHSDGVSGSYKLEAYPGLATRHPTVIAGVLYRDYRRRSDDATVVVVKEP